MTKFYSSFLALLFLFLSDYHAHAQISRERVDSSGDPVEIFDTQNLGLLSTLEPLDKNNLGVTIKHTFGIVTDRPLENFLGLDFGPNVRFGLDYGISDTWSLGIGRSSRQKVVDLRSKLALLRQNQSDSVPLGISLTGGLGITTQRNGFDFTDRMSYFGSVSFARLVSERLALQVSPLFTHFNTVFDSNHPNDVWSIGLGGQFRISRRYAIFLEYFPLIGDRPLPTENSFSIGLNIDTGGHVFQLFFTSTFWHTEQYALHNSTDNFWDGDFRFGFNVNRLFGLSH